MSTTYLPILASCAAKQQYLPVSQSRSRLTNADRPKGGTPPPAKHILLSSTTMENLERAAARIVYHKGTPVNGAQRHVLEMVLKNVTSYPDISWVCILALALERYVLLYYVNRPSVNRLILFQSALANKELVH